MKAWGSCKSEGKTGIDIFIKNFYIIGYKQTVPEENCRCKVSLITLFDCTKYFLAFPLQFIQKDSNKDGPKVQSIKWSKRPVWMFSWDEK